MIVRFLVSALALGVATWLVPGLSLDSVDARPADSAVTILLVAAIFGVVNAVVKPLFVFVTSPFLLLTLGLFLLLVNASLLMLVGWVCSQLGVGWSVAGFWPAFWGALLVSVVSFVLNSMLTSRGERHT
ncbi:MAG: phage holin family protein [Propioniciclava sp.]